MISNTTEIDGIRASIVQIDQNDISRVCKKSPDAIILCMGTHTQTMSKNIAISDEVYHRLKREKGDRSFSEVIAAKLDTGGEISDVAGQGIIAPETHDAVSDEIGRLSDGTLKRALDETS